MKKSDKSENLFSAISEVHGQARTTIPMPLGQVVDYFNDETDDLTINAALGSSISIVGMKRKIQNGDMVYLPDNGTFRPSDLAILVAINKPTWPR